MKRRAAVILGFMVVACATSGAKKYQWGNRSGYAAVVLHEGDSGCKKKYITRAVNMTLSRPDPVTWTLVNACEKAPPGCPADSKLALEFAKWEYTPKLLGPNEEPKYSKTSEAPLDCQLKNEVRLGSNLAVRCGLDKKTARAGTYRFQVVFTCDGKVVDNWDPVIVIEP